MSCGDNMRVIENEEPEPEGAFPLGFVRDLRTWKSGDSLIGETDSIPLERVIERIRKETDLSDKAEELIKVADEVRNEISDRDFCRVHLWHSSPEFRQLIDEKDTNYISLTFRGDKLVVDWNSWNGQKVRCEFKRTDAKQGIPDEQLLQEKPAEWISMYLNSDFYKESFHAD